MKTILVTGGAGFIGSNFIRYMFEKYSQCKIVNLDLLTYAGNLDNIKDVENNAYYSFVKGNIVDKGLVNKLFSENQFDYIINFAAETHVDRSIHDPEIFIKTNVLGTQVLLDVAKENWQIGEDAQGYPRYREGVRYIQISTDEVYGSLGVKGKFTEESPLAPNSPYSASKASADMLVRAYNKTYMLPINITRCSNNYGPYQNPEKLIPFMIKNAMNNKLLPLYGNGMQIRDWLHVIDHCSAIDAVLHKGKSGEVYNIGGNNEKPNIEIIKFIVNYLNKPRDLIVHVEDRLGHDKRYAIDNSRIMSELDWSPKIDFTKGLRETINWYIDS